MNREKCIIKEEIVGGDMLKYNMYENGEHYGVSVLSTLFGQERITCIDELTTRKDVADEFFEMCVRNLVLPSTLKDIAEDYISQIYSLKNC